MLRLLLLHALAWLLKPLVRKPPARPQTILYLKPDHLGDLLLATPVVRQLRLRFPEARIVAMVGPWAAPVLAHDPHLDALLVCPFPGFERATRRGRFALLRPYIVLLRYGLLLRRSRYDLAIIGRDDHWWGALLVLVAGIPLRMGFALPECRPLLNSALPWNPREHVTRQGLMLVAAAAGDTAALPGPADAAYRYQPDAEARRWAESWLAEAGLTPARLLVIHAGTGGRSKLWPNRHWAQLAHALHNEGWQVLLTGGPGEEKLVADLAALLEWPVPQLVGRTSVAQLAALLEQARAVLGVDSGPLHLAAAVGTPSLHLFGPGDPERFGPWAAPQHHVVLRAALWCSPCGVFGHCPRGPQPAPCMAAIGVAEALAAAEILLGATPGL